MSEINILKCPKFWEVVPRGFQNCGSPNPRDPPPPVRDAHASWWPACRGQHSRRTSSSDNPRQKALSSAQQRHLGHNGPALAIWPRHRKSEHRDGTLPSCHHWARVEKCLPVNVISHPNQQILGHWTDLWPWPGSWWRSSCSRARPWPASVGAASSGRQRGRGR